MKIETVNIKFKSDNKIINGMLHLPDKTIYSNKSGYFQNNFALPPLVVGSHGLEGSMDSAKQLLLARILPKNGVAFLRFSHRGCGTSEGSFVEDTSIHKRVEDMINAVNHILEMELTSQKLFLFGSSLGGSTCIAAWSKLVEKGITPFGAIVCAAPVNSLTIERIPLNGNDNRPTLPLSFFQQHLVFDLTLQAADLRNVLIFHGDKDKTVPLENGYILYKNAKSPKKIVVLKDGDHQMSNIDDQMRFKVEVIEWINNTFFNGYNILERLADSK